MTRVLHVLSQRPLLTGSGVTLDATVRLAAARGWEQAVVVGTPSSDPQPAVADLPPSAVRPLRFEAPGLELALPGMSDVMPYPSTRFQDMSPGMLASYREAWRAHLRAALREVQPALIHAHHVWLLSALARDLAPELPLVIHSHATGLRQMELCPHLAEEVRAGCRRADLLLALHTDHARALASRLGVSPARVRVVGAGYRDDLFHAVGRDPDARDAVYAGKLSAAKGLPWLLDAWERLPGQAVLHVAGGGAGAEAEALRARLTTSPRVRYHGALSQEALAALLRRCAVFVLPSFYEGLPLVLVEALAAGCRLVATDLPAVREDLAPRLGEALSVVPLPRLRGVDRPEPDDLPRFTDDLTAALEAALRAGAPPPREEVLRSWTWGAAFERIEAAWHEALDR